MNLETITLPLPAIFKEIEYKLMRSTTNPFVFAGGALSDLYMGRDYKDIDIFIEGKLKKEKIENEFGVTLTKIEAAKDDYHGFTEVFNVYQFTYKEQPIEIIETKYLRRVYDFDFRFRQFYYQNGVVKASTEAMRDIQEKKLVLVNPYSSISSLCRAIYFARKYGFKVEKNSMDYLLSYINENCFGLDKSIDFVKNNPRLLPSEKNSLSMILSRSALSISKANGTYAQKQRAKENGETKALFFADRVFPYEEKIKHVLFESIAKAHPSHRYEGGMLGIHFNQIRNFSFQEVIKPLHFYTSRKLLPVMYKETLELVETLFKRYRVRLLTAGWEPSRVKEVEEEIQKGKKANTENNIAHRNKVIRSFLKELIYKIAKEEEIETISKIRRRFYDDSFDETLYVTELGIEQDKNRIGDIIKGNTFRMRVFRKNGRKHVLSIIFRRTTDGRYTISKFSNVNIDDAWYITRCLIHELQERHPDVFVFQKEGIYALYDFYSARNDYYFENKRNITELNDQTWDIKELKQDFSVEKSKII